jgi:hypothetical protein
MKEKAQKPPSETKYEESHPTVSIRVTRELCDELRDSTERRANALGDNSKRNPGTASTFN